jgi:hypothetical protein
MVSKGIKAPIRRSTPLATVPSSNGLATCIGAIVETIGLGAFAMAGGRPRGMTAGRAKALALKEAYRMVKVKVGDDFVFLPAIQTICSALSIRPPLRQRSRACGRCPAVPCGGDGRRCSGARRRNASPPTYDAA